MNKNIKRIIAIALAIGTVSAVAPATSVNLLTTKAYAAADDNTDDTLDSLELETSSGTSIKLYDDDDYKSDNKVDDDEVDENSTYYAKTSSSKISINTDGPDDKYIKVFKGTSDSTKGKDVDDDITLSSGTTTIIVKIYDQEPESNVRYDNDDEDAEVLGKYTIKVKYTGDDSNSDTTDAEDYDEIYLDKLTIDNGTDVKDISLSESKIAYTYDVASNISEVIIKAVPEDEDDDTITIDGTEVDDSDKYKKKVSLKVGVNKFEIKTENEDDDDERVYTITITRAAAAVVPATVVPVTTTKANQWVSINGRWQYNDSLGKTLTNQWLFDKSYQNWYFLGSDGNMQTGWIINSGKYYYLNANGAMASNTTINGYKVDGSGAWIK